MGFMGFMEHAEEKLVSLIAALNAKESVNAKEIVKVEH
jgi:hypothetical protein